MPYIKAEARIAVQDGLLETAGDLNYAITLLLADYLAQHSLNYRSINDCLGALEGAKLEFYRRIATPYEEEKRKLNGDVY
jgi:uncharacterized protein DUF6899